MGISTYRKLTAEKKLSSSVPLRQAALKFCSPWVSLSLLSFLGPCPAIRQVKNDLLGKVKCPAGKSTCPGRPHGTFFEPGKLHKAFAGNELQKLHVMKFCNLIRPEDVILNQKNATFSLVNLKWFAVVSLTGCLAFYFWYNIGVYRNDVRLK